MLSVPRLRDGSFSTELFARYQRSEQAFILALMEMVVSGVSTRKVSQITEELCGAEFSKSKVSSLCQKIGPIVTAWNNRPLTDHRFSFVIVDARRRTYPVSRRFGRHRINIDGYREVLGFQAGDSESESTWSELFAWLKSRGLKSVDLITSDSHGRLVSAIRKEFQGTAWQRCQTHFMRNILDAAPKSLQTEIHGRVRAILDAPDLQTSRLLLAQTIEAFESKASKAMKVLEEGFDDATAVLALPERYHKRLRTTNSVERMNEEICRRERVIPIFPNR